MPTVTFLIGLPGSGKTTYRASLDAVMISSDDLIEQWAHDHGVTYSEAYMQVHLGEIHRRIITAFDIALAEGKDVVVDRTNVSRKARAKFLRRVPSHYQRIAVVFDLPRIELDRRLAKRAARTGKSIDSSVVDDMQARYQPPRDDEFDLIRHG